MGMTGERIRRLRERHGWTQLELAAKMNINNSVLSRIESGKRPIEDELLIRFAEVFDTSADDLLGISSRIREESALYHAGLDEQERLFFEQLRRTAFYDGDQELSAKDKQIIMEALLDTARTTRKIISRTSDG